MREKNRAYIYAGMVVFFWSTVSSAFKLSLRSLSVVQLLFFSSLTAAAVLFLILLQQKKVRQLKFFSAGDYLFSALLGFLNPFLYYLVLFRAYSLLPAQQAQPLNMIWGIVLVVLSIPLLKQKPRAVDFLALLICFFGVIVISTEGNLSGMRFTNATGVALALGSSLVWSLYWILNVKDDKDPLVRLFVNFTMGSLFVLVLFIREPVLPPLDGLAGAVYVGLFEMGITFFLWLKALKLAEATVNVAILVYLVPFLSFVFIHILVGERILFSSVAGALLIVFGTFLNKYKEFSSQHH
jgi:drug/metabolite transporter (DMT)-like permease